MGNKRETERGPVRRVVNPGGVELVMSSDGEEEAATSPADEATLRESVTTIAAAQLVRKANGANSPVSPVAVPLQQTEIIPAMAMASPARPVRVASPPPPPAPAPAPAPPRPKQAPPPAAARPDRTEIANMEVEKEEPAVAAPKRSWSSIVSVSAKNKSQKTKKNFPTEVEKSGEEERKGKKKGKGAKKEPEERRESPRKEEPEALWEEPQEEYLPQVVPEVVPELEDVVQVVPVEEELAESEGELCEHAIPLLVEEDEIEHLLVGEEELQEQEQEMRDYMLRLASSEQEGESDEEAVDELEEEQHYLKRYEDPALSTFEDTDYVEADNEVPYFCIVDRETVIDGLEDCESFYHDAHKVVHDVEPLEGKALAEDKLEKEVSVDEEAAEVVESSPVVESLSTATAAASADTSKRNRRPKKKRR